MLKPERPFQWHPLDTVILISRFQQIPHVLLNSIEVMRILFLEIQPIFEVRPTVVLIARAWRAYDNIYFHCVVWDAA